MLVFDILNCGEYYALAIFYYYLFNYSFSSACKNSLAILEAFVFKIIFYTYTLTYFVFQCMALAVESV